MSECLLGRLTQNGTWNIILRNLSPPCIHISTFNIVSQVINFTAASFMRYGILSLCNISESNTSVYEWRYHNSVSGVWGNKFLFLSASTLSEGWLSIFNLVSCEAEQFGGLCDFSPPMLLSLDFLLRPAFLLPATISIMWISEARVCHVDMQLFIVVLDLGWDSTLIL